jgi:hypothetical protein
LGQGEKSGGAGRHAENRRGLGQKAAVKRDITSNLRDLTVIVIIAAAGALLAISTDNNFFVPVFAAEAVAATVWRYGLETRDPDFMRLRVRIGRSGGERRRSTHPQARRGFASVRRQAAANPEMLLRR